MNLNRLENLKNLVSTTNDLNPLRSTLIEEFTKIIHFIQNSLEKDVKHLEQDVQNLQKAELKDTHTLEIIGNLVTDFSELRKDLETEI